MARRHRLTERALPLAADSMSPPAPAVTLYRRLADQCMVYGDWTAAAAFEEQALQHEHDSAVHWAQARTARRR